MQHPFETVMLLKKLTRKYIHGGFIVILTLVIEETGAYN